ncbi:MAG: hypothetical protein F4Z03_03645 [Gemmatimonadetes bacterium]|nr:hypothetical protein [Gemmatimonadota bacterium]MYH20368.1 hypothetical protein [Gemmatimonadota bacterium]
MKPMIKSLLFCLIVSAATAAIPAAGLSTLLAMTGIIEDDRALIWIFLALALPIFVIAYVRVTKRPRG